MPDAYLMAAARTPIGKFQGGLASVPAPQLAAAALRAALERAAIDPGRVDELILGQILAAGVGQAPARQAARAAGLATSATPLSVNQMCGSGLQAVMLAARAVRAGDARLVAAGGMENMSQAPHLLRGVREGWKYGHQSALDSMIHDGLWCAAEDCHMGDLAEWTARHCGISRAAQDEFAWRSHQRAARAMREGLLAREIVPITVPQRRGGPVAVAADEGPRADSTLEALARLKPAFSAEGTVTAGNASQLSDGAAAVLVGDEALAAESASPVKARIVAYGTAGRPSREIFLTPIDAVRLVLDRAGLTADAIDLFELNEAYAAQMLACQQELRIDPERVNVNGGAIALGHPIGASGARVLVTLLHALEQRQLRWGLASLCLGGGNAVAMIVERV